MKRFPGTLKKAGSAICVLAMSALAVFSCSQPESNTPRSVTPEDLQQENLSPVVAVYGFNRDNDWFRDKSEEEILDILGSWKVNAVFGVHEDAALAEVLRRGGIKIFAEFGVFVGESYWNRYPDSRPLTAKGQPLEMIEWYAGVNPSNEQVRKEKLANFQEMLEKYPLDGIWLDFIRWPCRWEKSTPRLEATSFDSATVKKFSGDTGIKLDSFDDPVQAAQLILDGFQEEWTRWRCDQITGWVAESRKLSDRYSPDTKLGLFGVPWILDYDNAIISVIGQDYEALGGYIDVFSPMVYHLMCGRPVTWIGEVTDWIGQTTGKAVLPIIQTVNSPGVLSPEELGEATKSALTSPESMGVIFFNLEGLDEKKLEAAREIYGQQVSYCPGGK